MCASQFWLMYFQNDAGGVSFVCMCARVLVRAHTTIGIPLFFYISFVYSFSRKCDVCEHVCLSPCVCARSFALYLSLVPLQNATSFCQFSHHTSFSQLCLLLARISLSLPLWSSTRLTLYLHRCLRNYVYYYIIIVIIIFLYCYYVNTHHRLPYLAGMKRKTLKKYKSGGARTRAKKHEKNKKDMDEERGEWEK